jgi:hypothetical protein
MPQLSAFTWCGALDMSGNNTHIQDFYELLPTLWGTEIDFTEIGSDDELKLYAWSVVLGSALYELEHAGNQANPLKAYDLIPLLEQDFGLTPGPFDTVQTRQAAIAAAEKFPLGAIPSNIVNTVKLIVGAANFYAYAPNPAGTATTFPPTMAVGNGPGQFRDIRIPPRFVQLVDPVVSIGSSWCAYQNLDTTIATPELLLAGDTVVVEAGNTGSMEQVTVLATSAATQLDCTPGYNYFQAFFQGPHDVGSPITTGTYPYWWSTQRLNYMVVASSIATSRPKRAKLDAVLAKIMRTVDQWAIVSPSSTTAGGGTVGPLTIGAPMGTTSIGAITYTNSM